MPAKVEKGEGGKAAPKTAPGDIDLLVPSLLPIPFFARVCPLAYLTHLCIDSHPPILAKAASSLFHWSTTPLRHRQECEGALEASRPIGQIQLTSCDLRSIGSALLVLASLARILPVHAFYGWRSHTGNDKQCAPLVATAHVTGQVEGMITLPHILFSSLTLLYLPANFTFTLIVGQGVLVQIDGLKNFTLRPNITSYNYHIHSSPVNEEAGNITARCAATLSHHDPLNVTENLKCDPEFPYLCQEGDLSGKVDSSDQSHSMSCI